MEIKEARDEVLRKIGLNMFKYQLFEQLLKKLIPDSKISGHINDLKKNKEKRIEEVSSNTMGILVRQLMDEIYIIQGVTKEEKPKEKRIKENHLSFTNQIEVGAERYKEIEKNFRIIVDQRNDLIHHLLPKYNFQSIDSLKELSTNLDEQHNKIMIEIENLRTIESSFKKRLKASLDVLDSDDFQKYLK